MSPLVLRETYDFPKHVQNINNVLLCKCETNLYNPCDASFYKKYPSGAFFYKTWLGRT